MVLILQFTEGKFPQQQWNRKGKTKENKADFTFHLDSESREVRQKKPTTQKQKQTNEQTKKEKHGSTILQV